MKKILLSLCIAMPSILLSMQQQTLAEYIPFLADRIMQLADIQPSLTGHQIARLMEDCEIHAPENAVNLINACQLQDTQAVDQTLRDLINDRLRGNVSLHRGCKGNFCMKDAFEKYFNQIYSDDTLQEIHHFNRHQLLVMAAHFKEPTYDAQTLYQLVVCLYYDNCSEVEKQKIAQMTQSFVEKHKNEMDTHQHCMKQGFCLLKKEE